MTQVSYRSPTNSKPPTDASATAPATWIMQPLSPSATWSCPAWSTRPISHDHMHDHHMHDRWAIFLSRCRQAYKIQRHYSRIFRHYTVCCRQCRRSRVWVCGLIFGAQHAAALRTVLSDLEYPQPDTIILCDNTTAIGIATDSVKQKWSKATDMRFHWVHDRVHQKQFWIAYIASAENLADYFTKNLPHEAHSKFLACYTAPAPRK